MPAPMHRMALADAQNLAIRKLLTRAAFESTVTPGPPLPKSHPSPALAAKLHLECAALYSSARALVKTPGASRPSVLPSSSRSKFTRSASLFEDLVILCVRYAFANIPANVGRVFFSKHVALPFMRWRMLRHVFFRSPVSWK